LVPAHLGFLGDSWATRRAEFVVLAVAVAVAVAVVVVAAPVVRPWAAAVLADRGA
jgi:hypothetical protein